MLFGTVVVVLLGTVVVVVLLGTVVVVLLGTVVVVVSAPLGVVVLVVAGEDGGEVVLVVPLDAVAVVVVVVDVAAEPSPVAGRVVVLELDTDDAGCDPLDVDPTFAGDDEVPGDDVDAVDVVVVVLDAAVPLDPLAAFPTDPSVANCDTGVPDVPDVPTACSDAAICAGTGGCDDTCVAPTATAPAKLIETAAVRTAATPTCASVGTLPTKGSELIHATGPATTRTRPIETSKNARTTVGSKCVPAQANSSARAA